METGVTQLRRVVVASERYRSAIDEVFGLGLTESQTLSQLASRGELSPGELGTALSLSSGSMTNLLDRLESAGLVNRRRHPQDRRRLIVSLTERSETIVRRSNDYLASMLDQLRNVPVGDVTVLLSALADAFTEASERIAQDPADSADPDGAPQGHRHRPSAHRAAQHRSRTR